MRSLLLLAGIAGIATACDPPRPPTPTSSSPSARLLLGAAGVPQGTFGADTAPEFAAGFAGLAADGFDAFLPIFLTNEDGSATAEPSFFLPPEALPGVPEQATCAGARNPWVQSGDIGIVLPAYLLTLEQSTSAPLDTASYQAQLEAFRARCLGGDDSKLRGLYLYDEPATATVSSRLDLDDENDFLIENVRAMAEASRALVDTPTFVVEAALPFALPLFGVPASQRPRLEADWRTAVDASAPSADVYGFDLYAVDAVADVSPIGDYVELAYERAPEGAMTIAVLQGFGMTDMGIAPLGDGSGRQPTRDETRAMTYEAIARGAQGLFWYGQSALTTSESGVWRDVRDVVSELRTHERVLMAPGSALGVQNAAVHARALEPEDEPAVLVVNPTDQPHDVVLPREGVDLFSGAHVARELTLAPYQALLVQ